MNTGSRLFWFSRVSLSTTCTVIGWLCASPSCSGGITTLPFSFGSRVMIQRVVARLSPFRVLSWLTCRVPRTSNNASSAVRSGLPNWVTSLVSRVSSTVSPEFRRLRSTLAVSSAAWAVAVQSSRGSKRAVKRVIECFPDPDVVAVRTRICVGAIRRGRRGSCPAIVPVPDVARLRGCLHSGVASARYPFVLLRRCPAPRWGLAAAV
ncbi:hypothetical protein D3C81_1352550 [compost metagenome]